MRFSVVIPLYNKEQYIAETLDSVKKQIFNDYEVLIINDSSTDNSLNIAKSYEIDKRFHVYTKTNGGVSEARNYGIEKAKGEYVCFLDADDLWDEKYLEEADRLLKKYRDKNFLCFAFRSFIDEPSNIVRISNLEEFFLDEDKLIDYYEFSMKGKRSIALTSGVVIKTNHLRAFNIYFQEGVSMGEDIDLWVRAANVENIIYCNKPLMLYRVFAKGCLSVCGRKSIKKSYNYWLWYDIQCYSPFVKKFTTRMIYTLARDGFKTGEYKEIRYCLRQVKGSYLFARRFALYLLSFCKELIK